MSDFDPFAIAGGPASAAEESRKMGRKLGDDDKSANIASGHLRSFVERIERLEEEKKAVAEFIKDVYGESKSMGFNPKILKRVIALRRMDAGKRTEEQMVLDTYLQALGMVADD